MGNIYGVYDAKEKGFIPGGGSMHQTFIGHGPEKEVFEKVKALCHNFPIYWKYFVYEKAIKKK